MSQVTGDIESKALLSYLNAQRQHVIGILEGLDEEDLRRQILPSGWTCLGMVQHLALDIEQFWFRGVVAGEQSVIDWLADGPGNSWLVGPEVPVNAVFDAYRQEIERASAIITVTSPDAMPAWWPDRLFGNWRLDSLREIMLHVIAETACHAGHLDAARELIDGRKWMTLD